MLAPVCRRNSNVKPEQAIKNRKRAERFRILIIGRANSGKTTILKRVCNSTEDPEILDGTQQPLLQREKGYDDPNPYVPERAQQLFEEMRSKLPIFNFKYKPKGYVALRGTMTLANSYMHINIDVTLPLDMDKANADCSRLLEVTAEALDDDTLQLLFVATQQITLKLCTTHAIEYANWRLFTDCGTVKFLCRKLILRMESVNKLSIKQVESLILRWYPHILVLSASI
ncbi:hypothetical protein C0989_006205 [Termitomyces sp. Mn162]|nr:hypothetical protein C0989_006205 [Termitomyces sp. Mn162]